MEIRTFTTADTDQSLALSQYAFQYRLSESELEERRNTFIPEEAIGIFENDKLQAKLHLFPFEIYLHGKTIPMGGIAGVATWPENRRKGYVRTLLHHALKEMNEKGQILSMLSPFSMAFYRRFGWELFVDYKKYKFPVTGLPKRSEVNGTVLRNVQDVSVLDQIYEAYAARYNGMLVRNETWWRNSVFDESMQTAVYYSEDGVPEGYTLYRVEKKEMTVEELVFLNETARKALWTYLADHDSMVNQVTMMLVPPDDLLPFLMENPKNAFTQEVVPYFMARIINAKSFMETYPFLKTGEEFNVRLKLEDADASWNDGLWQWNISADGHGSLSPIHEEGIEADLTLNIGMLTTMLMGYKRPKQLHRYELLKGTPELAEKLERVVPMGQTALLDHF